MATASRQHVSGLSITVDGSPLAPEYLDRIRNVKVRNIRMLPDVCILQIQDPRAADMDRHPLKVGCVLEVKMGARTANETKRVFKGQIVATQPDFKPGEVNISVVAYDKGHALTRGKNSAVFQDETAVSIIKKVAKKAGLAEGDMASSSTKYKYMAQANESDWDFCWRLANADDLELRIEDNKLHVLEANRAHREVTLRLGEQLRSFRPRITGAQQYKEVVVKGYDPQTNQVFEGRANTPQRSSQVGADPNQAGRDLKGGTLTVTDTPVHSQEQANKLAQATLNQYANGAIEAEGVAFGTPDLAAGVKVKVEGCGTKFSGGYVITSVEHAWSSAGYETTFKITGRSPRTLSDLLTPSSKRSFTDSLVIGTVTNNKDPKKMGRVKVKFETLEGTQESEWAHVSTPSSGNNRGFLCLPVAGETVVIGFEHGDICRPIVVGSVFNGKHKPGDRVSRTDGSFGMRTGTDLLIQAGRDESVVIGRDVHETIGRDYELTVGRHHTTTVGENETHTIGKDLTETVGKSYTLEVADAVYIKTKKIVLDAQVDVVINGKNITLDAVGKVSIRGAQVAIQ